jgi:AI-2 transport protein TqsA
MAKKSEKQPVLVDVPGNPSPAPPSPPINVIHVASAVGLTVLLAIIMRDLSSILKPFFVAIFLSILIYPAGTFFTKYKIPRGITYLVILVALFFLFYVLGALISVNVTDFIDNLPLYELKVRALFSQALEILSRLGVLARFGVDKGFDLSSLAVTDYISLKNLTNAAGQSLGSFVSIVADALVVIFFMIFILLEVGKLPERVRWAYGPDRSVEILEIGETINKSVIKYLGVVTLINFVLAVSYTIILTAMGEDFAILWGVLAFLLNFIPYIGSYVAVFLPVLTALVQFSPGTALALLVVLIAIQVFLGNFVQPRIMGRHLNLSPLVVLISLAFWGWLWGIAGMFLAVPITATIKIVLEHVSGTENIARLMSEGAGKEEEREPRKLLSLPEAITKRVRIRR